VRERERAGESERKLERARESDIEREEQDRVCVRENACARVEETTRGWEREREKK